MQQPSLVFSHVQWQQHRLMLQIWMPFQVQQHEQVPWLKAWQRFCKVAAATASSHLQWILQPVLVFSNFSVHRGTTQMFGAAAAPWVGWEAAGMAPVAKALRLERSNTALDIRSTPFVKELASLTGHRGWEGLTRSVAKTAQSKLLAGCATSGCPVSVATEE
jgi:hypothetical protein